MGVDRKEMGYNRNNREAKKKSFQSIEQFRIQTCIPSVYRHGALINIYCVLLQTENLVCFVVYCLILPIYNGSDTVVPPQEC